MKKNNKTNGFLRTILIVCILVTISSSPLISNAITNTSMSVQTGIAALNTQLIQMLIEMIKQLQAQLQQLIAVKTASIIQCDWCGNSCINWANKNRASVYCTSVMPPTGSYCQNIDGTCQITSVFVTSTLQPIIPTTIIPNTTTTLTACVSEGNSISVTPIGFTQSCCSGLILCPPPTGILGSRGTCQKTCSTVPITTVPNSLSANCSWCGNQCILSSTLVGKNCANVMPVTGTTCVMLNNSCTITNSNSAIQGVETHIFEINLSYGMENDDVKVLQSLLSQKGYFTGIVSGYFGWQTDVAVKAFQLANNLPATGFVGSLTRELLNN